jgi:hypothetical protein
LEPTEFLKVSKDFMELMKKMEPLLKPGRK